MTFDIIVNPAGAGGKTGTFWESIEPQFAGTDYTVHKSTRTHGIREIVHELTSQGKDVRLVIVGGDGSMNEAVNGIADFSRVSLGLIPSGSANDLAKDAGLSPTTEEQIARIRQGNVVRAIDVGEMILHNQRDSEGNLISASEDRTIRFNVSAGLGWDAEICYWVERSKWKQLLNKLHLGKLIYGAEACRTIFGMHPFVCTVDTGGQTQSFEKCVFCAVMNHRFEGGGFMFGPHAEDNDGILDLCTINDITIPSFFMLFPVALKGKQFGTKYAVETRAPEFRFKTSEPVFVHTDGEVQGKSSDVTIRIMKEKLRLLF